MISKLNSVPKMTENGSTYFKSKLDELKEEKRLKIRAADVIFTEKLQLERQYKNLQPLLRKAYDGFPSVNPRHLFELMSMRVPPKGTQLVLASVAVLFDQKPKRVIDKKTGERKWNYWHAGRNICRHPGYIHDLGVYDVPDETIQKVRKLFVNKENYYYFMSMSSTCFAARGLSQFILHLVATHQDFKKMRENRLRQSQADEKLENMLAEVKIMDDKIARHLNTKI